MNLLLVSIALAIPMIGQPAAQPTVRPKIEDKMPAQKLDGQWTVTYAELDGKKVDGKGFTEVTIKNNVVTCKHDGKEKSWRLSFGPHNMVRCTEMIDGKAVTSADKRNPNEKGYHTHHGVYIASSEYFCLCLNKGMDRRTTASSEPREGQARAIQPGTTPRFGENGAQGANLVIILHRTGSAPTSTSR